MKYIPAGTFKARCLAVMKRVQATGEPVIVTKRGTPVVKVVPAQPETIDIFGSMTGKVKIIGEPVIVTKRGTPVVKVIPAQPEKIDIFGSMTGKVKIVGDIESPIPVEWESTTK